MDAKGYICKVKVSDLISGDKPSCLAINYLHISKMGNALYCLHFSSNPDGSGFFQTFHCKSNDYIAINFLQPSTRVLIKEEDL